MVKAGGKCESNCLNWANYVATIRGNLERFDDRLRSLHAGCRRFESFIAHIVYNSESMTTTSGTTSVVLLVSKHTLKTTLDDKKVDYKWTTLY
jgi:hypothetical protein